VPAASGEEGASVAAIGREVVSRLSWKPEVDLLIEREGPESWLDEEVRALGDDESRAVAYFLKSKAWPEGPSGRPDPARTARRGDLARLLLYAARHCAILDLEEGIVRGQDGDALKLAGKSGRQSLLVAPDALLFADFGEGAVPVRRVAIVAGDKIRYHLANDGRIDQLLVLPGRQGISDDRYSSVSSWQVALEASDLASRLDQYLGSGSLVDILPARRGVSGRVTELTVVGTKGRATLKGFSIRTALGLKDTLFVIERQRSRSGALRRVVFTGRGWGHGLGLCQVGAYGMALRGASYREILEHYYSGVSVERVN
jgi:stage II sporulation protein D